jgi:hypothetical protein
MSKRINHNDLIPWFTRDHRDLPPSYLASCQKFFDELQAASRKQQASSSKQVTTAPEYDIIKTEREKT